jgi:adenosylcobinamide-GDP ribazoletransferase
MTGDDSARPEGFDIVAGLGLLTRLPIPVDGARAARRGAAAAWAWPVAGAVVGALGGLAAWIALALGLSPPVAGALVLATQMMATGALHEDGLADTFDGLWGGWDCARRLAIMKDSQIGTYGVLALLIVTLIRWSALSALIAAQGPAWGVLIAAGATSRAPMAVLMAALPNARGSGLAQSVGRPGAVVAGNGLVVALAIGGLALGPAVLPVLLPAAVTTLVLGRVAQARIGGQTGDILGASQQLAEAAILATLAATLA